jgi:hypothetical protein
MSLGVRVLILALVAATVAAVLRQVSVSPEREVLILAPLAVVVTGLLLGWQAGAVALLPVAGTYVEEKLRRRRRRA